MKFGSSNRGLRAVAAVMACLLGCRCALVQLNLEKLASLNCSLRVGIPSGSYVEDEANHAPLL